MATSARRRVRLDLAVTLLWRFAEPDRRPVLPACNGRGGLAVGCAAARYAMLTGYAKMGAPSTPRHGQSAKKKYRLN